MPSRAGKVDGDNINSTTVMENNSMKLSPARIAAAVMVAKHVNGYTRLSKEGTWCYVYSEDRKKVLCVGELFAGTFDEKIDEKVLAKFNYYLEQLK